MQNAVVHIANRAIFCKLWPKTISGMDRTRTMGWGMDRTRTMGVVVQVPPAVFPREKQVFPEDGVFGVGNLFLGLKTMGVVVQLPPAVFPREKQVLPWDKGVF